MVLTLTAGQRKSGIDFKLVREAVIAGKIVDQDGDPAANITVQVPREIRQRGDRQIFSRRKRPA